MTTPTFRRPTPPSPTLSPRPHRPLNLTVVANRVPIRETDEGWETSVGGLTTALLPVLEEQGGTWVGMGENPGLPERQNYPADDPDFLVRRVPLSTDELDGYYYGMANQILWPLSTI